MNTPGETAPEWAHRILTALLTGEPLTFGAHDPPPPADIQRRLAEALHSGQLRGVRDTEIAPGNIIHIAPASECATEAAARARITRRRRRPIDVEYRGIWLLPQPYGPAVHLFSDVPSDELEAHGWRLLSSALPGDAPYKPEP